MVHVDIMFFLESFWVLFAEEGDGAGETPATCPNNSTVWDTTISECACTLSRRSSHVIRGRANACGIIDSSCPDVVPAEAGAPGYWGAPNEGDATHKGRWVSGNTYSALRQSVRWADQGAHSKRWPAELTRCCVFAWLLWRGPIGVLLMPQAGTFSQFMGVSGLNITAGVLRAESDVLIRSPGVFRLSMAACADIQSWFIIVKLPFTRSAWQLHI